MGAAPSKPYEVRFETADKVDLGLTPGGGLAMEGHKPDIGFEREKPHIGHKRLMQDWKRSAAVARMPSSRDRQAERATLPGSRRSTQESVNWTNS